MSLLTLSSACPMSLMQHGIHKLWRRYTIHHFHPTHRTVFLQYLSFCWLLYSEKKPETVVASSVSHSAAPYIREKHHTRWWSYKVHSNRTHRLSYTASHLVKPRRRSAARVQLRVERRALRVEHVVVGLIRVLLEGRFYVCRQQMAHCMLLWRVFL